MTPGRCETALETFSRERVARRDPDLGGHDRGTAPRPVPRSVRLAPSARRAMKPSAVASPASPWAGSRLSSHRRGSGVQPLLPAIRSASPANGPGSRHQSRTLQGVGHHQSGARFCAPCDAERADVVARRDVDEHDPALSSARTTAIVEPSGDQRGRSRWRRCGSAAHPGPVDPGDVERLLRVLSRRVKPNDSPSGEYIGSSKMPDPRSTSFSLLPSRPSCTGAVAAALGDEHDLRAVGRVLGVQVVRVVVGQPNEVGLVVVGDPGCDLEVVERRPIGGEHDRLPVGRPTPGSGPGRGG